MIRYSLAINSKVPLAEATHLEQPARLLGEQIAVQGHTLLTPVSLSLAYRVAQAVSQKAGLSIGFSQASSLRAHIVDCKFPLGAYDWLYCTGLKETMLLAHMTEQSQALVLVGGVMDNMSELSLALNLCLPIGILVDETKNSNNDLLRYLQVLPIEKQRYIVVHKDAHVLLGTVLQMIEARHKDLDTKLLAQNEETFDDILKSIIANDKKLKAAD